jgi:hypothetical protein
MAAVELLERLRGLGVLLSIDGDGRLAYDAPADALGDDLLAEMRSHRDELLALVERFDERAAIVEHDGGLALDDLAGDPNRQSVTMSHNQNIEPIPGVICPWCRRGDCLIDADDGLGCDRCGRLAFRCLADGWVRVDHAETIARAGPS